MQHGEKLQLLSPGRCKAKWSDGMFFCYSFQWAFSSFSCANLNPRDSRHQMCHGLWWSTSEGCICLQQHWLGYRANTAVCLREFQCTHICRSTQYSTVNFLNQPFFVSLSIATCLQTKRWSEAPPRLTQASSSPPALEGNIWRINAPPFPLCNLLNFTCRQKHSEAAS